MTDSSRKPLPRIKTGAWARGLALARVSLEAGARAAGHALGGLVSRDEDGSRLSALLKSQAALLARELGELKGSLMKVGQMLSVYGEHVLPPEANALLKSLQSQSPPLAWSEIHKVLRRELAPQRLDELEISREPVGSASLGQVHLAVRKSDGRRIALKVQYPGVDQAIESDLSALRRLLLLTRLVPESERYEELFGEVREMLRQEVDYRREREATDCFRRWLADDPRFVVPETFPEYSSGRVLATSFEEGLPVDSPEVKELSQERRNALAEAALELYFRELFRWKKMQTDPHFGNYRVRAEPGRDRIVLLDFGATREFSMEFLRPYAEMVHGAFSRDEESVIRGARGLGFLREGDSEELGRAFVEVCSLVVEPLAGGLYDWGSSDLPKRAFARARQLAISFKLRPPPREVVFLDRKMGGVFIFLSTLGARIDGSVLLRKYFDEFFRAAGFAKIPD